MTQAFARGTEQLRHSWLYYLIFPPETAPLYRACCIKMSVCNALGGIGFGILFSLGWSSRMPASWFATGLLLNAATVVFSILTLLAARRSQALDRATVHFAGAENYSILALTACGAILLWPLWIAVLFWTPLIVLFHRRGLHLLHAA